MHQPTVEAYFDGPTNTVTYLVIDPKTKTCALIDTVLGYDAAAGATDTRAADELVATIEARELKLEFILETHVHADHLSAAPYIKEKIGGQIGIGGEITTVQEVFGKIFNEGSEFERNGGQFDCLFVEGDRFQIGTLEAHVLHTPGHTPACMTYVIGDAAFVGDTIFMPDFGTARTDFPGGSATELYNSVQKIFTLPGETRVFTAHDYKASGRDVFAWESTVAEQKALNIHVGAGKNLAEFVAMREARDAELAMPKLILPSVQVNMRAGNLPQEEENGTAYLKIPLNAF